MRLDRMRAMWAWRRKQRAARRTGARYYGDGGTIHASTALDVEVHNGRVVSVWFRCQELPFEAREVGGLRAAEMDRAAEYLASVKLTGVEIAER